MCPETVMKTELSERNEKTKKAKKSKATSEKAKPASAGPTPDVQPKIIDLTAEDAGEGDPYGIPPITDEGPDDVLTGDDSSATDVAHITANAEPDSDIKPEAEAILAPDDASMTASAEMEDVPASFEGSVSANEGTDPVSRETINPLEDGAPSDTRRAASDVTGATEADGVTETDGATEDKTTEAEAASDATAEAVNEDEDKDPASASDGDPLIGDAASSVSEVEVTGEYKRLGLYVHIPFCKSKCAYCDFYSTDKIRCRGNRAPKEMKRYCRALKNNLRVIGDRTAQYNIDTVYIGGGTPTALSPRLLLSLVKEIKRNFYLAEDLEFTVEMNPATANARLLRRLRRAGVNRLSIGLQSAHDHELAVLSRIHNVGDFTECFQMAREAGFDNISVDVMFGIPEQTVEAFAETLEFVCNMKPEHISMYNLRIEEGTLFGEKRHMLPLPDEDAECEMYFGGIDYLASRGYHQYEISNFAKEGMESRHNLRYWHGEEYIGCGPAAHSYFGGRRFSLRRSLSAYCEAFEKPVKALPVALLDENYAVDMKEEVAEYLMLRWRLTDGISTADFDARFGASFEKLFGPKLKLYLDHDLMRHEDGRYYLTPRGMFVSNYILARVIPFEPKFNRIGKG